MQALKVGFILIFGLSWGRMAFSADFNGDGTGDVAIFRAGSGLWAVRGITRVYFGSSGDSPVPGDYDGKIMDAMAVFRGTSGLWAVRGVTRIYFGGASDEPVPGDLNGDRRDEMGIFRSTSGLWAFRGLSRLYFGSSSDEAIPPGKGARRGELPVSGQTTVEQTGDDGYHRAGSAFCFQTFINGCHQITLDRNTGLMWVSDGNAMGCAYGAQTDWNAAVDWCYNLSFGGYIDWRLPNTKELQSICDYGENYPSINPAYFGNTRNDRYWTSTTLPTSTTIAWCLQFTNGRFESAAKTTAKNYLRAVRGP